MKYLAKVGMTHTTNLIVDTTNQIPFSDERMPPVLATPWLIFQLEFTARDLLANTCLESHERSVGTYVEVEHLAPAPVGSQVVCQARVIHVAGDVITFQVEARDQVEVLSRGIHRRRVIDVDRFARRVQKKRDRLHPAGG